MLEWLDLLDQRVESATVDHSQRIVQRDHRVLQETREPLETMDHVEEPETRELRPRKESAWPTSRRT